MNMDDGYVRYTGENSTSTEAYRAQNSPEMTIVAVVASLGVASIILAIVLIIIFCRRKNSHLPIASTLKSQRSTLPERNISKTTTSKANDHNPVENRTTEPAAGNRIVKPISLNTLPLQPLIQTVDLTTPVPLPTIQKERSELLGSTICLSFDDEIHKTADITYRPLPIPNETLEPPSLPRRARSGSNPNLAEGGNLFREGTKAYHLYHNAIQSWEMSRDDITIEEKIGKGHFGYVYSGVAMKLPHSAKTDHRVAIKTLKNSATDSQKKEFLYEYEIMKLTNSLDHSNILKLLGSITKTHPCMIVLELMTNGNLRSYLRATRCQDYYYNLHGNSNSLTERHLLQFALDIANGMEGIASLQLLHRDLAARNVLLDENLTCKIADFGFAKDILNKPEYKSKSVFQRPRPTRWLAPESLLHFKHSIRSDVWSYGIVLWEIVTLGNLPYPKMKSAEQVSQAIAQGYRMPCPRHCSSDLYRVMMCCWEEVVERRPKFSQLVDKMKVLLGKATLTIDMDKLECNTDYVEVLPPEEHEVYLNYESEETLD